MAGLVAIVVLLIDLFSPMHVIVGGVPLVVGHGASAAQVAELAGYNLQPGNMLDVTGEELRRGAGRPAMLLRNGTVVAPETRLHRDDVLTVIPGADVVEPCRERATFVSVPPQYLAGMAPPAVAGLRRVRRGLISGKVAVQLTASVPTVAASRHVAIGPRPLALTFDDGPWPTTTAEIVAILVKHNAHATFFLIGDQVKERAKLVREEVAADCEVGIHTWRHSDLTRLSAAAIRADLLRCQDVLLPLVGKRVWFMRPPYGALNSKTSAAIRDAGFHIVLWSGDTNDWRRPGAAVIYARIMKYAHPHAIILCHDGGGPREGTVQAVSRAVPALQERGYDLVTVSQLLGLAPTGKGGAVIVEGRRYQVEPAAAGLRVTVDGAPAGLSEPPVEIDRQLLLPIAPTADLLGLRFHWDQQAQIVTLIGPVQQLILRVNSTWLQRQYGTNEQLPVPPIIYHDHLMLPLWVIIEAAEATATYDHATKTLNLISMSEGLRSGKLGQSVPPRWGQGGSWQDQLSPQHPTP